MGDKAKATATVVIRNGNYTITRQCGRRKSVFEVTAGGAVSDKAGGAVLSSDIAMVRSALILNSLSEAAGMVQRWWDGR